ncbi:unnamed protein product, partial [Nesidiocoris tenuis]
FRPGFSRFHYLPDFYFLSPKWKRAVEKFAAADPSVSISAQTQPPTALSTFRGKLITISSSEPNLITFRLRYVREL